MEFKQDKLIKAFRYKRLISHPIKTIELAKSINVSRATIHRFENGSSIDMDTFVKICSYLDLSPCVFFG